MVRATFSPIGKPIIAFVEGQTKYLHSHVRMPFVDFYIILNKTMFKITPKMTQKVVWN